MTLTCSNICHYENIKKKLVTCDIYIKICGIVYLQWLGRIKYKETIEASNCCLLFINGNISAVMVYCC